MNAHYLNQLKRKYTPQFEYRFIEQQAKIASTESTSTESTKAESTFSFEDTRYYEEIIYQDKTIPTRSNSWHDYFNGLIWLAFAQTKAYLNRLHWQDIARRGHKQRSASRDRITHFDECGMILLTDLAEVKDLLKRHAWEELFIGLKERWFAASNGIMPLHFGHANLEMLRAPFIGLTAKTIVIESRELLKAAHIACLPQQWDERVVASQQALDTALLKTLEEDAIFAEKGKLMPLPILGIPGWHNQQQDAAFYQNKAYFMPKRT